MLKAFPIGHSRGSELKIGSTAADRTHMCQDIDKGKRLTGRLLSLLCDLP